MIIILQKYHKYFLLNRIFYIRVIMDMKGKVNEKTCININAYNCNYIVWMW